MSSLIAKPRLIGGPLAFLAALVVAALLPTPPIPVIAGVGCLSIGMLLEIMADLEERENAAHEIHQVAKTGSAQ